MYTFLYIDYFQLLSCGVRIYESKVLETKTV